MKFNEDGQILPAKNYILALIELRSSILVRGSKAQVLSDDEITQIYINRSFAEEKAHPNNIDGYYECDLMELADGSL